MLLSLNKARGFTLGAEGACCLHNSKVLQRCCDCPLHPPLLRGLLARALVLWPHDGIVAKELLQPENKCTRRTGCARRGGYLRAHLLQSPWPLPSALRSAPAQPCFGCWGRSEEAAVLCGICKLKGNALGLLFFFCLRKMQAAALHVFHCITSRLSYSSNQRPWQERGFSTRAVFELELL